MSSFTLNTKEAIGDFNQYDKKTQGRMQRTLKAYALHTTGEQQAILKAKVKNPTGRLSSSIRPQKINALNWEIGPNNIVYAWFIEAGAAPGQNNSFKGYHYVRDSLKRIKSKFIQALKRDVERS